MIEQSVSLASNGVVKVPGYEQLVRFGYTKNRGVYRLHVDATGEWEGLTIRAFWHVPDGKDPVSSLVVDGYVAVPASVTAQPGSGCVTFEGSDGSRTVTSADLRYRVSANSGTEDGTMPEPDSPAWQKLVDAVHTDATTAEQAKTDAQEAAKQADMSAGAAATSAANAGQSAQQAADSLQELKDGIASGNFKGEKGDTGPQGPQGEPGPDNLVIITATANATVQGEYIPDTTYSNALADIQANKAVMIKLDNVPGRYYIPYSSSNAEILASAGTVSGSNQSIELYLIKWTAQTNTITLTGTKEGCIADGGTAGQVLVKKSDDSFDTEWTDNFTIITYDGSTTSIDFDTAYNLLHSRLVILINTNRNISFNLNIYSNSIRSVASIGPGVNSLIAATLYWSKDSINFSFNPYYTVPNGGSTGQVLAKKSNAIGDTEWIAPPSSEIPEDYPQIREDVSKLKEDTAALQKRQNVLAGSEIGNPISVDDAFSAPLCGLTVYGRSTQDGTPTPDAPVPIVSAGDGGSVAVTLSDGNGKTQTLTLPTPNGLPGIPVTSGGTYTDSTGQQWVCDEVDLERGVKVQRVNAVDLSACAIIGTTNLAVTKRLAIRLPLKAKDYTVKALCNRLPYLVSFTIDTIHFYVDANNVNVFIPIDAKNPEEGEYILFYALATPIETPLTP